MLFSFTHIITFITQFFLTSKWMESHHKCVYVFILKEIPEEVEKMTQVYNLFQWCFKWKHTCAVRRRSRALADNRRNNIPLRNVCATWKHMSSSASFMENIAPSGNYVSNWVPHLLNVAPAKLLALWPIETFVRSESL